MFAHFRLRTKILLVYAVPLVMSIVVAIVVYGNVMRVRDLSAEAARLQENIYKIMQLEEVVSGMQRSARGYIIFKNDASLKSYEESEAMYLNLADELKTLILNPEQKERFAKVSGKADEAHRLSRTYVNLVNENKAQAAVRLFSAGGGIRLEREARSVVSEFEKAEKDLIDKLRDEREGAIDYLRGVLVFGTVVFVAVAIVVGFLVSGSISRGMISASSSISATSAELSSTIAEHEKVASSQAAMVAETTATIEELGASARQTTEQATSAASVAQRSAAMTSEGQQGVREAVEAMTALKEKISAVADQILKLSEQTAEIGGLANIVRDIAGQTNMLALNAAVEAVRAGEHGKGFGVLASEVRKLADQSKKSAEQAATLVAEIQKVTNSTIMVTEEGQKRVESVLTLAQKVGDMFNGLSSAVGSVYENAQQVLLNAKQQSTALGQVVVAINNINAGTRETAAGLTQTRTGITRLNEAAVGLKELA